MPCLNALSNHTAKAETIVMRRFWLAMLLLTCGIGALPSSRAAFLWHLRARCGQDSPALFVRRALIGEDVQPVRGPFPLDLERLSHDRDGDVARALYAPPDGRSACWKSLEQRFPRDAVILALDAGSEILAHRVLLDVSGGPRGARIQALLDGKGAARV